MKHGISSLALATDSRSTCLQTWSLSMGRAVETMTTKSQPEPSRQSDALQNRAIHVGARTVEFLEAGSGPTVLLIHGWALTHNAYGGVIAKLAKAGMHVVAPALPGCGGSSALPSNETSFVGYAKWLNNFVNELELAKPASVIGHSFGGGVAIQYAHDFTDDVSRLVLVSSIGGATWMHSADNTNVRSLSDRPFWDWGRHLSSELFPLRQLFRVTPSLLADAIPNILRHPGSVAKTADLARSADLHVELDQLRQRGIPVTVFWGTRDRVIPRASFETLCSALGQQGTEVDGTHSWILSNPTAFAEALGKSA